MSTDTSKDARNIHIGRDHIEFYSLDSFLMFASKMGFTVKELGKTDSEDPYKHYYIGNDVEHFLRSGGDLLPNNGYGSLDVGDNSFQGSFIKGLNRSRINV